MIIFYTFKKTPATDSKARKCLTVAQLWEFSGFDVFSWILPRAFDLSSVLESKVEDDSEATGFLRLLFIPEDNHYLTVAGWANRAQLICDTFNSHTGAASMPLKPAYLQTKRNQIEHYCVAVYRVEIQNYIIISEDVWCVHENLELSF